MARTTITTSPVSADMHAGMARTTTTTTISINDTTTSCEMADAVMFEEVGQHQIEHIVPNTPSNIHPVMEQLIPPYIQRCTGEQTIHTNLCFHPPQIQNVGSAVLWITASNSGQLTATAFAGPMDSETFYWSSPGVINIGSVSLEPGAYAIVRCQGESGYRALLTDPAGLGEACGHAGLACQESVLLAGETQVGETGQLVAWTAVSGTYQLPHELVFQSLLPRRLYCRFAEADELVTMSLNLYPGLIMLRQGHALLPPPCTTENTTVAPGLLCHDAAVQDEPRGQHMSDESLKRRKMIR
jgi:hypothetical protein